MALCQKRNIITAPKCLSRILRMVQYAAWYILCLVMLVEFGIRRISFKDKVKSTANFETNHSHEDTE